MESGGQEVNDHITSLRLNLIRIIHYFESWSDAMLGVNNNFVTRSSYGDF